MTNKAKFIIQGGEREMPKVLIDIPDEVYKRLYTIKPMELPSRNVIALAIRDGIVFDELTNGELIQKLFPEMEIQDIFTYSIVIKLHGNDFCLQFDLSWWNRKWGE